MQEHEPSEAGGRAWLNDLLEALGGNNEAIKAAVTEVAAMCADSPPPVGWIDFRKHPQITVYVLQGGIVHVVRGETDRQPQGSDVGASEDTRCRCSQIAVASEATCSLTVVRTVRATGPSSVMRLWGIKFGDEDLALSDPTEHDYRRAPDPAPFARGMITAIARAKAGRVTCGEGA